MKKFEYLIKKIISDDYSVLSDEKKIQEYITKLGDEGWELVSYKFNEGSQPARAIFKRIKKEKQLLHEECKCENLKG